MSNIMSGLEMQARLAESELKPKAPQPALKLNANLGIWDDGTPVRSGMDAMRYMWTQGKSHLR